MKYPVTSALFERFGFRISPARFSSARLLPIALLVSALHAQSPDTVRSTAPTPASTPKAVAPKTLDAAGYASRGNGRQARGDHAGALADYDESIARSASSATNAHLYRFVVQRRLGQGAPAAELARTMAAWPNGWIKTIARFLTGEISEATLVSAATQGSGQTTQSRPCEAYFFAGIVHLLEGDAGRAREFFEKCVATNETTRGAFNIARAELVRLSAPAANPGPATSAQSPAKNPTAAATAAFLQSGATKRLAGDLTGAIADFTKGIELSPSMALLYINRGLAYRTNGDASAALADFSKAIDLNPNFTTPFRNRAALRDTLGDSAGAADDRARADKLDELARARGEKTPVAKSPKKTPPGPAAANVDLLTRAKEKQARGDLAGALGDFAAAIERQPARADLYYERGRVRQGKRDSAGAHTDFTKAIELDASFANAYAFRGILLFQAGDIAGALADCTKAITLQPAAAAGYVTRGDAFSGWE